MALITCKECGKEISDQAGKCPNCGYPINQKPEETKQESFKSDNGQKPKKKAGGCLKSFAIGAFAFLIILIIIINSGNDNDDNSSSTGAKTNNETVSDSNDKDVQSDDEPTQEEYVQVTSSQLIDAFKENQVKCKNTYDGKNLEVTGTVQSMGTDILNDVYVSLGHDTEYALVGIQCYAKDEEVANIIADLKKGDTITVRGTARVNSLSASIKKAEIVQ